MTQLNKITGQMGEMIKKMEAMSPQWKPAPGQRNLLKEWIAQAKAEIAERATAGGVQIGESLCVTSKICPP